MTEFCHDEVIMPKTKNSLVKMKKHQAKSISSLTSGSFALYNSTNMHRGTKSKTDGKRLLLRMMVSDNIKGLSYSESIFTPFNM